jgi:hypothetical protein
MSCLDAFLDTPDIEINAIVTLGFPGVASEFISVRIAEPPPPATGVIAFPSENYPSTIATSSSPLVSTKHGIKGSVSGAVNATANWMKEHRGPHGEPAQPPIVYWGVHTTEFVMYTLNVTITKSLVTLQLAFIKDFFEVRSFNPKGGPTLNFAPDHFKKKPTGCQFGSPDGHTIVFLTTAGLAGEP